MLVPGLEKGYAAVGFEYQTALVSDTSQSDNNNTDALL
jgi:hypothetical protein